MRLSLLLVLAVCALLPAQAAAQFDFHTAWRRHLGWGAGPGYHAYSQGEINNCAALGHPHEMGCTAYPSLPAQKATMMRLPPAVHESTASRADGLNFMMRLPPVVHESTASRANFGTSEGDWILRKWPSRLSGWRDRLGRGEK